MVEDIQRTLVPAAAIGMTTLWVREDNHPDAAVLRQDESDLSHVHHVTDDLTRWLEEVTGRP